MDVPQIPCPRCGVFVSVDKIFCIRCGYRIIPLTSYDLAASDFIYPPDRDALESLEKLTPLSPIANELFLKKYVREILHQLRDRLTEINLESRLGHLIRECGIILGLRSLPRSYILYSDRPIAFTFGSKSSQYLVLSSGLLRLMDEDELKATIGHELGHLKCGHIIYHTLAEILTRGIELSLGFVNELFSLLSPMIRLPLLSWHRDSEISADRAALLTVGNPAKIASLLQKLSATKEGRGLESDPIGELFSTHPTIRERIERVIEFYKSGEYRLAKKKIENRLKLLKAISPVCRFCGSRKPLTSLFCPACGRSQV
ncbi:MAG: hypothetical protein DRN59_02485 [Thaumarchaeota archaeon]|nr:MAG: hypothetical protein DRN59_02485 [Nitrososphaerota archaeon]